MSIGIPAKLIMHATKGRVGGQGKNVLIQVIANLTDTRLIIKKFPRKFFLTAKVTGVLLSLPY